MTMYVSLVNRRVCHTRERRAALLRCGLRAALICAVAFLCVTHAEAQQRRGASSEADERVEAAMQAYITGADDALERLTEAEARHPFHPANSEVLYFLASAQADAGQYAEAEQTLTIFMNRYGRYADTLPRVDEARVLRARCMTGQGRAADAITHLRTFLSDNPRSPAADFARFEMARAHIAREEYSSADTLLRRIAANERSTHRDASLMLLAEIAAEQGDFETTENIMRGLFQTTTDRGARNAALFKLGEIYRESGNLIQSIDAFRRIRVAGTDRAARELNAGILFEIAQTYEQLNHPLEARVGFYGVYSLFPGTSLSTMAWHRAILNDADFGNFARAEQEYIAFRAAHPDETIIDDVRYHIGQALIDRSMYTEAIEQLRKGLDEFPGGEFAEQTYLSLGIAQLGAELFQDAERTFNRFAETFPDSELVPQSFFLLAQAYLEQDRYTDAIEAFTRVAERFATADVGRDAALRADEVRLMYADALAREGSFAEAVAQCQAVTHEDLKENATFIIGTIYTQAGAFTEAAEAFSAFIAQFPDSERMPLALYSQGEALMQADDFVGAEAAFAQLQDAGLPATHELLPIAQLQIAFCRFFLDDMPGMSNALVSVIDTYAGQPEAGDALYWLAFLHRRERAFMAAAETYGELVARYPTHPFAEESSYMIGECYVYDNMAPYAPPHFIATFETYPLSGYAALALTRAGEIYNEQRMLDAWLDQLQELADNTPDAAVVPMVARAAVLLRAQRIDEAAATIAALDMTSLPPVLEGYARAIYAGVLYERGAYADALAMARDAVVLCDMTEFGLHEALFHLARVYEAQGAYAEAEEAYARLLAETTIPNNNMNAAALVGHANTLLQLGAPERVAALADDAALLRPSHDIVARGMILKGDAEMAMDNIQRAAQFYQRATILYGRLQPHGLQAYRKLVDAYTRLGMTEHANEARALARQIYPDEDV